MMMLSEIRDMLAELGVSKPENTYMGRLDVKKLYSIGAYNSKRGDNVLIPLGGMDNKKSDVKSVTFLVHWNKSPRETEKASALLVSKLTEIRNKVTTEGHTINFIIPTQPIPVDTDNDGIYEMVIDADVYYSRTIERED